MWSESHEIPHMKQMVEWCMVSEKTQQTQTQYKTEKI